MAVTTTREPGAREAPPLDEGQRRVVEHDGAVVALGGPGVGKSTVLVERWVRLASSIAPHRVLLLVGSREEASALRDALPWRLPQLALVEAPVHTWHAFAYHLVTRYYRLLDYPKPPVLLTGTEQWAVVRELLASEDAAAWRSYGTSLGSAAFVDEVADFCLRAGRRPASDDDLETLASSGEQLGAVARFCLRYRRHLAATTRVDVPALMAAAARLLSDAPEVRAAVHRRFPHVLVDDAQTLSPVDFGLLRFLALDNLVCAGDAGAAIESASEEHTWLDRLDAAAPGLERITLSSCHRYGHAIGDVARRLISHAPGETGHVPREHRGPEGVAQVRVHTTFSGEVEAAAREVRRAHIYEGVAYDRMAILCTQPGVTVPAVRQALRAVDVPWRVGARPPQSDAAVRWILDLCRLALFDDCPDDVASGVLSSPLVGLEPAVVRGLRRDAFRRSVPLETVLASDDGAATYRALRDIVVDSATGSADVTLALLLDASPWARAVAHRRGGADAAAHADSLGALARSVGRFVERRRDGTMRQYLESSARADIAVAESESADRRGVTLAGLHGAAGREWDVVVVCGASEGAMPRGVRAQGIFDPWGGSRESPAEHALAQFDIERRTFYVALTRARRKLIVSTSPGPAGRAAPSRFIEEAFGTLPEPDATVGDASPADAPLTIAEHVGALRRTLARPGSSEEERAAAACALARIPEMHSRTWWWRRDWTPGVVPLAPSGKLTTSYSRIGTYENCGLQYVLQSVLGLDPQTTYQMKFGSLVHKLIEMCERKEIETWDQVVATYRDGFDRADYPNVVFARTYYRSGIQMLKRWWHSERSTGETIDVEYSFDSLDVDGHTIRGRIDRVAKNKRGLFLVDYKTSRSIMSPADARKSLQLAIYYLAARTYDDLRTHGEPYSMQLVYPAYSDFNDPTSLVRRTQTPPDAEETIENLKGILADAVSERFAPNPEADCQWCRMRPLCPRWPEGRETGP